eukprot:1357292-Pleurochrysis_carterae.AAC.2
MAPWARGIFWDCADPVRCTPVERSTRHTDSEGARQIDRGALRAAAATMQWADADIVEQVGEGGVEVRSGCELLTVLAFHHPGLVSQAAAAAKAVDADMREQWVSSPTRHLPYVPCHLQPRDVIMQARQRVTRGNGGAVQVEDYAKPRLRGAGRHERGRPGRRARHRAVKGASPGEGAIAIIGACGLKVRDGEGKLKAVPYVVDAESAYRFCPVQRADRWTQCIVWWDEDGRARKVVDRRMGFGGAFAPNRFERISTLVVAWMQRKQAAGVRRAAPLPPGGGPLGGAARGGPARRRRPRRRGAAGAAVPAGVHRRLHRGGALGRRRAACCYFNEECKLSSVL